MLSVILLGRPRIQLDRQSVDVPRRKSRAVVYYLAARSRPVSREHLLALLWPDLERSAARQTLRVTLHGLRKALGAALVADDESLALAPEVEVDVRLFERRLSPPTTDLDLLVETLDLYRGDFLDGLGVPGSPAFESWVEVERHRYQRLAIRGLAALAVLYEARERYAEALEALDRALAFDPLQEDLQGAAMRLHYLAGDRASAIRRYEGLRRLLDEEMGVPPMAETRALYDSIIDDSLPRAAPRPAAGRRPLAPRGGLRGEPVGQLVPFVGRGPELQTLAESTPGQARRLILLEGEPGIGKTRLAQEHVRKLGAVAIAGAGRELEQALPYQPIVEALRGLLACPEWPTLETELRAGLPAIWLAEVARLLPELAKAEAPAGRSAAGVEEWRLWEGINQLLVALGRLRPIAVFVDDLQWADSSTLGLLGFLVRQASPEPISFLAATRQPAPRSPAAVLLQALLREGRLVRLVLPRLGAEDVRAVARYASPRFAYPLAEWLLRSSEGNPFILTELLRHLRDEGVLLPDETVDLSALSTSSALPRSVYTLIQSRLRGLSEEARRVLDAAVAVGREFEFEVAYRAAALSEAAALDALDELRSAGLVVPIDGSRYAFDHNLTMEVAYHESGEPRHHLLHRRVAETLEALHRGRLGPVAGLLARHFVEGNAPDRAAPYAYQAGLQAAALSAWSEAIAFYEQALRGSHGPDREAVLMALGAARFRAGLGPQASEAFREALALADTRRGPAGRARATTARLELARSFLPQGRFSEAIALARQVREAEGPKVAVEAEFLWGTALSLEGSDLAAAARHLEAAEALHLSAGSPDLAGLSQTKFELGSVAAQQGQLEKAIALYHEALAVARRANERQPGVALPQLVLAHNNLAYHLHLLGDPAAAGHGLAGLRIAREKGLLGLETYLLSTLGEIALGRGDLVTAEERFAEALAVSERLSMPERIAGLTANLGLVALGRGETALAIHHLSTALARADDLGTRHLSSQIRIWLAPLLPPTEARARLAEARAIAEGGGRMLLLEQIERLEGQVRRDSARR